jgi:hypothetical protein
MRFQRIFLERNSYESDEEGTSSVTQDVTGHDLDGFGCGSSCWNNNVLKSKENVSVPRNWKELLHKLCKILHFSLNFTVKLNDFSIITSVGLTLAIIA